MAKAARQSPPRPRGTKAPANPKSIDVQVEKLVVGFGLLGVVMRAASEAIAPSAQLEIRQGDLSRFVPFDRWCPLPNEGGDGTKGFVALLSATSFVLSEEIAIVLPDQKLVSLRVSILLPQDLERYGPAYGEFFSNSGQEQLALLLGRRLAIAPASQKNQFWIDNAVFAGAGVVANGWIANLPNRSFFVATRDFSRLVAPQFVQAMPRLDVHEHLRGQGALSSQSQHHGFTFVLPRIGEGEQEFYFLEIQQETTLVHGPIKLAAKPDENLALELVRAAFGDIRFLDAQGIEAVYRPILSVPDAALKVQSFRFGPAVKRSKPVASIIVPFYGDSFFLNCIFHLQRILDDRFELVLVVDDPRIWPEIHNAISLRSAGMTVPTLLVRNVANYGFGAANNIGASLAQGDVLFLMNSDIIVLDAAPLVAAADAIRERKNQNKPELLVGFSLLYEDDSIQHIGMEFRRSSLVGDLYLADHPMKGLPFALYDGGNIRSVEAVTAALMGLSANLYQRVGGFDRRYERGDFEDADLCLKARKTGAEIEVHVHPGLYHLERQSIPAMGNESVRGMITYMNCSEFNRRWSAELVRKRVFRVVGQAVRTAAARG